MDGSNVFAVLADTGVIGEDLASRLTAMSDVRDFLMYGRPPRGERQILAALQSGTEDLALYAEAIARHIGL